MSTQLAAIDLGSNSFHMIVAQLGPNQRLTIVDRIKEPVRLAAGLDASGNITAAAADRVEKKSIDEAIASFAMLVRSLVASLFLEEAESLKNDASSSSSSATNRF